MICRLFIRGMEGVFTCFLSDLSLMERLSSAKKKVVSFDLNPEYAVLFTVKYLKWRFSHPVTYSPIL